MLVTVDHRALGEELYCIIVFCDQVPEGSNVRREWVTSVRHPGDTDYWAGSKAAEQTISWWQLCAAELQSAHIPVDQDMARQEVGSPMSSSLKEPQPNKAVPPARDQPAAQTQELMGTFSSSTFVVYRNVLP